MPKGIDVHVSNRQTHTFNAAGMEHVRPQDVTINASRWLWATISMRRSTMHTHIHTWLFWLGIWESAAWRTLSTNVDAYWFMIMCRRTKLFVCAFVIVLAVK